MRITNASIMNTYLSDVQNNLQSMDKLNQQLDTGKVINKVSDDPFKAIKVMNLQSEIKNVEEYNYNCDEVTGWLDITDESLNRVGNLTSEIKTLLTSIQGTFGEAEVKAVKTEINEKMKQIGEAMNATYAGKYIFGGSATDNQPVKMDINKDTGIVTLSMNDKNIDNTINTDLENKMDETLKVKISDGISLDYNLTMDQITKTAGEKTGNKNGLDLLNSVVQNLNKEPLDIESLMKENNKLSSDLDNYMNDVLNNRSIVGAKTNTVEAIKSSNEDDILEMTKSFSLMQDVDFAEKFMKLKEAEMAYNASLQVGAKLIKPTILDYLR